MLRHKLFHRARKIVVPESELKSKKKGKGQGDSKDEEKEAKGDSSGGNKGEDEARARVAEKEVTGAESSQAEGDPSNKLDKGTPKSKKVQKNPCIWFSWI